MLLYSSALLLGVLHLVVSSATAATEICRVERVDILVGDENSIVDDFDLLECHQVTGDAAVFQIEFVDDSLLEDHGADLEQGEWFLQYDPAWVNDETEVLVVPEDVTSLTLEQVMISIIGNTRLLRKGSIQLQHNDEIVGVRRLQRNVTESNRGVMIVARVSTADAIPSMSTEAVAMAIFSRTSVSFLTQMTACSFGNLQVRPYLESEPVLDITLPRNVSEYTYSSFYGNAEPAIVEYLTSIGEEVAARMADFPEPF